MKHISCKKRPLCGFTLIELLVVIAIIAILAAMLLPALVAAKSRAYAVNDINNCKQTMLSMLMYCGDNNEIMPAPGWLTSVDCWASAANTPQLVVHTPGTFQTDYNRQVAWFSGIKYSIYPAPPGPSQLYQYLKDPKLLICPQDNNELNKMNRREILTSYSWNGAVVGYQNNQPPFKITRFKSTNIIQWENTENSNWGDFSNGPMDYDAGNNYTFTISERHGKAGQVGRIDGSAARESMSNLKAWASTYDVPTAAPNDLWCNPNKSPSGLMNGH